MCKPTQGVWQPAGCVSCELVCVCVSLVRVVIICPASTHTALVSSPSLAVLHLSTYLPTVTEKHARLALFRATRSPVRGAWPPARLALTRPASASRLAERYAMGPPGAALLARCAAQSCEKQGGLLSLSMAQRGCWCSRAAVQWREGLIGGDLVLHQRAQHAPSPGAETCWWATGASFSVLSLALCSMSQYSCRLVVDSSTKWSTVYPVYR